MKHLDTQVAEENVISTEKAGASKASLVVSSVLLATVLSASAFLFFANQSATNEIGQLKSTGQAYDASIAKLNSSHNIAAAESIQNNITELQRNIRTSEAQRYITELRNISKTFRINFNGFSYDGGKITTAATALGETTVMTEDAIAKVSKLIGYYRTSTGSVFELGPVVSVSGQEQRRSFPIEFSVNEAFTK